MPHVVVTGGAGFIASHIVDAYVERGVDVTVVDDLSTGERRNVNPKAHFVEGSITSAEVLADAVRPGVDLVNHHAAQIDVRKSVADPAFDAEVNVVGSLQLFEQARRAGVKSIIFASSGGAAYGEPVFTPQTEEHPLAPMSPYGCAKISVEHYLGFYRQVYGVRTVALRYANVYGPRQRKDGEAGVVAIFAGKMLAGETVTINGTGEQTRDYVFVDDVVRANIAASEGSMSGAFNVGSGVETSVKELFEAMAGVVERGTGNGKRGTGNGKRETGNGERETGNGERETGNVARPQAVYGPAKLGEQMRSVLDGTKLRALASLPAPVSLVEGLGRTIGYVGTLNGGR